MLGFWYNMAMLNIEAQEVIWLRSIKMAKGGKAGEREARRMVSEKLTAAGQAGFALASGKGADSVVSGYRKKVRANRRRLLR